MDIVIQDLAGQYAIETEEVDRDHAARRGHRRGDRARHHPHRRGGRRRLLVGRRRGLHRHPGRRPAFSVIAPNMLSVVGPLFAPDEPAERSRAPGSPPAGSATGGPIGTISGIPVYVSAAMTAGNGLISRTAAAEVYEDRIGALQVVEPQRARCPGRLRGPLRRAVVDARPRSSRSPSRDEPA